MIMWGKQQIYVEKSAKGKRWFGKLGID